MSEPELIDIDEDCPPIDEEHMPESPLLDILKSIHEKKDD